MVATAFSDIEASVSAYYAGRLAEHGQTARGVDWSGEQSQQVRFAELLRVADLRAPFSLNDWGCGYGALVDWLDERGACADYHGFDVAAPMVAAAAERFGGRRDVRFTTAPGLLPVADYTVASGIFNVRDDVAPQRWSEYMAHTLQRMAAVSRRGLAFNVLTSYSDPERMEPRLHYAEPGRWFDWCKRNLSRNVALLHDYGLYEFTVIVRFEQGGA